jgi:arylsulfate sulfotransferase
MTPRAASRTVFIVAILLIPSFSVNAVEVLQGPTLTMDPFGLAPLAGVVELTTDVPVQVELMVNDGTDLWTVSFPDAREEHYLPVLGLKPDRTYTIDVELVPGGSAGSLLAVTGPLPDDFPVVMAAVSDPPRMEPGYTLLDCFRRGQGDARPQYAMIVDSAGDVVWYSTVCVFGTRQLANGNLFYLNDPYAREVSLLGNETQRVELLDPGTGLHHDLVQTPLGTYLSLTRESVVIQDFPTSETDPAAPPATAPVTDDPVVEFLPDGTLRNEWFLTDMLHPTRIGYDSLVSRPEGFDWAHANAVIYDASDDSIIASLRHQDAVIKFSRATGDLVWILGPHENWPPEFQPYLLHPVGSSFVWQFHQHAPMITGDGTLVLFDNGNRRASPFDGTAPVPDNENFSRGVEYQIDEDTMHVRQVWEYGENIAERLYSSFICDADWLQATGNVLMTFGATSYTGGVSSSDLGLGSLYTRVVEATRDPVPEAVFDLLVYDPGGRITTYRSERIPSLYPQQPGKSPNGVGVTLRANKVSGLTELTWMPSPVDAAHDAAQYYAVYVSSSPDAGFSIFDTTAQTDMQVGIGAQIEFYKIVAANPAGTSGDEPAP